MTNLQQETLQRLEECASNLGKKCEFEVIPNSDNMMKYVEEVVNEDTGLKYSFRISVRNDGSFFSMCYVKLELEGNEPNLVRKYLRLLDERSDLFTYELSGSNEDMLFMKIEFDLDAQQYLRDSFMYYVFECIKPAFETCFEGMVLLCEKELSLEDAVNYALEKEIQCEETLEQVRYSFEHEYLPTLLLTDSEYVEALVQDREHFLFGVMEIICENNGFEIPYGIEDFNVKTEKYGEYKLVRLKMPEPVSENNCLEIVLSIGGEGLRYFTVEIGKKERDLFICEWIVDEDGDLAHYNHGMLNAKNDSYIAEIKKCLQKS